MLYIITSAPDIITTVYLTEAENAFFAFSQFADNSAEIESYELSSVENDGRVKFEAKLTRLSFIWQNSGGDTETTYTVEPVDLSNGKTYTVIKFAD